MTPRRWDMLLRKLVWAQDHGDRLTCILIAYQLRKALILGGPR